MRTTPSLLFWVEPQLYSSSEFHQTAAGEWNSIHKRAKTVRITPWRGWLPYIEARIDKNAHDWGTESIRSPHLEGCLLSEKRITKQCCSCDYLLHPKEYSFLWKVGKTRQSANFMVWGANSDDTLHWSANQKASLKPVGRNIQCWFGRIDLE